MQKVIDRPPTISNYVLDTIRGYILEGRYPPGSKLDQRQLAAELGVSLIPVRESLRQLEAEGFIRILPHRGAFLADLSVVELEEIYLIRENLEDLVTRLAVPNLSTETLYELGGLIGEMEQATEVGDSHKLFVLNRNFHFAIYQAAERPLLLQIITSLWDRSVRYRRVYTSLRDRQLQALSEHKAIYDACKAGDPIAAGNAVRLNVHQTTEGILSKIHNSRGSNQKGGTDGHIQD